MTTATLSDVQIADGTWTVDPLHSNANFEVDHAGVSVFRGAFKPVDAKLTVAGDEISLEGGVAVESITIDDENLRPHLLSPDFFDAERNPQVRFRSTEISGDADKVRVQGELEMAGVALPVEATGRLRGPIALPGGGEKLALELETTIDRTAFGMVWQMELPDGGDALANDVHLLVTLEFDRS